jgi:hypothetical protein
MERKKNYSIICCVLLFCTLSTTAQVTLLSEDFSGGTLPSGWSNIDNGGSPSGQVWEFDDPGGRNITAGSFSGNFAILDSDNYGFGNNQNATLETAVFATGAYETITLEYDYQYRDFSSPESCTVEVYDGSVWTAVANYTTNSGDNYPGATHVTIDITTEVNGASNAKVRFTYTGDWDWWWALDNITVTGTSPSSTDTYLGPGGVGNIDGSSSLKVWLIGDDLDADGDFLNNPSDGTNVSTWSDYSGNNNNYTNTGANRPTYNSSGTYNAVNFDASLASAQFLNATFTGSYNNTSAFFALNLMNSGNSNTLFDNNSYSLRAEQWSNTNRIGYTRYGVADYSTTLTSPFTINSILSFHKETSSTTMDVYRNNGLSTLNIGSATIGIPYDRIGRNSSGSDEASGDFYEVILFNTELNDTQRIIIDNYLSAKYGGVTIVNDLYSQDDTANGDFDYHVAGIGRAVDGSLHIDSQGSGIVRINNPSDLNNNEFLFWGEDVENATYTFSPNVTTDYLDRIDTKWRVSKTGDIGNVSVSLNATDITFNSDEGCNNLTLIVSNSSTFTSKTTYTMTLSSGVYRANGVDFSDGDYFSLEYLDTIVIDDTQAYNGSGTGSLPNTSDGCYKLLVTSTSDGSISLSENADVREVEVENGGKLVVENDHRLVVTNGIINDGDIKMAGTSQLIQTHTGASLNTGTGSLFIDQDSELTSIYRYNYWTSPVLTNGAATFTVKSIMKDGTIPTSASSNPPDVTFTSGYDGSTSPLTLSNYWIYGFINASDGSGWTQKLETGMFNPGEGFLLKSSGAAQNYTFKGTPNDGDFSFTVDAGKFSLLGNPYPSAMDANQLFADSANLATLYFWEHQNEVNGAGIEGHYQSGYIGGYGTRNATMGIAASTPITGTAGLGGGTYTAPGRYIPIGQGFFVDTGVGVTATVNFNNGQRSFVTEAGDSHFFRGLNHSSLETSPYSILKLGFESSNSEDLVIHKQIGVSFIEGNTFETEVGCDSRLFEVSDSDLYFNFNGEDDLVIAGVKEITDDLEVPLVLKNGSENPVYIMIDEIQNIDRKVYLLDKENNASYDLSIPVTLNLDVGVFTDRFVIAFEAKDIYDDTNNLVTVYYNAKNRNLIVEKKEKVKIQKVSLFKINSQKIERRKIRKQKKNLKLKLKKRLRKGIYVVNLITNKGAISKKIVIE